MKTFKQLSEELKKSKDDPCWKGYVKVGTKKKNGKEVPNCVPKEEKSETEEQTSDPRFRKSAGTSYRNRGRNNSQQRRPDWRYKERGESKEETEEQTSDPRFRKSAGTSYRNRGRNNSQKRTPDWRYKERGESVEESKDAGADTYFSTYAAAVQHARAEAEKKGFTVDDDDWFDDVNTGPGKPSKGKTVRHTLGLYKNGKLTKKGLAIQVYNRGTSGKTYELNYYIS